MPTQPKDPSDPGSVTMPIPTSATGLDQLVTLITHDPGLLRCAPAADVARGAAAADALNLLLVQAIRATGVANNGDLTPADLHAVNAWLRDGHLQEWTELHGDDESGSETGFHLVQDDGAKSRLFGRNAVDTVADGLYHLGFEICNGHVLNEDGNPNASLKDLSAWLGQLLTAELQDGSLANPGLDPYPQGSTGSGLDQLVALITADPGLQRKVSLADIQAGAQAADAMNALLLQAIRATGVANDHVLGAADLRDVNAWLRDGHRDAWATWHGDDEDDGSETGFHRVQDDGATSRLFGRNAVDRVADGLYHLGFEICDSRVLNEDGNANASLKDLAEWLNQLLAADLAAGALDNPDIELQPEGTTGTGLDQLVQIIVADAGLGRHIASREIAEGARAADAMNALIIEAIRSTGSADGGNLDADELREISAWLVGHAAAQWAALHGDDEEASETGFHLVQGDGASTQLFARNAVNTVADGLYHLGFGIEKGRLLNEDGMPNASLKSVGAWLNALLADELADGSLLNAVTLVGTVDADGG